MGIVRTKLLALLATAESVVVAVAAGVDELSTDAGVAIEVPTGQGEGAAAGCGWKSAELLGGGTAAVGGAEVAGGAGSNPRTAADETGIRRFAFPPD